MMSNKRIEIGDTVTVFTRSSLILGIVDYMPQHAGDAWIILENQDNMPVYVQSYTYILLKEKATINEDMK